MGSLPRRQTYVNQVRGQKVPNLLVDGGDCFFRTPTLKAPKRSEQARELQTARQILWAYNAMGYQAVGVGPADLQLGLAALKNLEKQAKFPLVCANIVDAATGKPVFRPHVVLEVGGVKIGVYSVIMDSLNKVFRGRALPGCKILDPDEVTRKVVAELKKSCDLVLALSNLNLKDNEKILDTNPGVNILIDPLSRNGTKSLWVEEDQYCVVRGGAIIVRIDGQGSRVGVLELHLAGNSSAIEAYRGYDVPLEPHILRHPSMTRELKAVRNGSLQPDAVNFDPLKPRLVEGFFGEEGCGACHEEQRNFWKGTKHAQAMSVLAKSKDQNSPDCFICHSYGYGVTFASAEKLDTYKEVQCECCHGWQPHHADSPRTVRMGAVSDTKCWSCHNPAITETRFRPKEVWSQVACPKIKK